MVARKSLVISNCQCLPLANALGTNCADMLFESFGAHLVGPAHREQAARDLVARAGDAYEAIITIPLSDDWGPLSAGNIRASFQHLPVVTISNIHFTGWHPDLTYIGGLAARVAGPVGDYHSRLALFGFLRGLTRNACVALFRDDVFAHGGYYDTYAQSLAELQARDAELDCRVTDILEHAMRRDLCFFSINHPTTGRIRPIRPPHRGRPCPAWHLPTVRPAGQRHVVRKWLGQ